MLRRPIFKTLLLLLGIVGLSGILFAQLESADRGILPIDSTGTLEIGGIHVDVGGKDALSARYAGWRVAQREGFKALWAKTHGLPVSQAPNLSDSVLDGLVSSIIVEREQIGPNRYIADLGVQFDRAKAGEMLGVGGVTRQSAPMLLIPVMVTGGTATSVELRNAWQRAWAQYRTSQSAIDYVRVSGLGVDPLLVNAAQTARRGRGWWRNIVDLYGASDILIAEVQVQRLYPGGPARARFIGRHGPDNQVIGGFTITAANSEQLPAMMAEGVRRMDELFSRALAAGMLQRDPTLDIPEPPPVIEIEEVPVQAAPTTAQFQVQIVATDVKVYNFAMAHLRTMGGITQVTPQAINPVGTSYVLVTYRGTGPQLAGALSARGWISSSAGTVVRMAAGAGGPPAIQQPQPQPAPPAPAPAPSTQPSQQPQGNAT
jgi:hypothetical protein